MQLFKAHKSHNNMASQPRKSWLARQSSRCFIITC